MGIVTLPMQGKKIIMILLNIIYAPKKNSNLISFGQLHKSEILYHDQPNFIIVKKERNTLVVANRYKNFFVLETSPKVMLMQGKVWSTYFLSLKAQIRLWHHRLGHASNTRIIQVLKLADRIELEKKISSDNKAH